MHWSYKIANEVIARNPDKEEYVCAAGISPSGSVHIGNFRDVVTSYFVVVALRKLGKKARLLFSWDEYDRFRKVPVNVAALSDAFEQYIGQPYVDVPNPFDPEDTDSSYATYFEKEFIAAMEDFSIHADYRYQAGMYRSGKYAEHVIHSLKKRGEIFDILAKFRTQESTAEERLNYYPVSIYCPTCGKDTTKIRSLSDDCTEAEYTCACGHAGHFNFTTDFDCKLAWKIDWPMRWMYEGVDFEPGGKDHASPMGSYQTSRVISEKIFGYKAPLFQGYEFIGIKGSTGKMSGSTGLNLTPATLLNLYQPEIILWLYAKTEPTRAFDFCFDDGILKQYFEFDRMLTQVREGKADELAGEVIELSLIEGRDIKTVPMGLLVQLGSVVNFNQQMLETVFDKINTPYSTAEFADRVERAKFWLEQCAPDQVNSLRKGRNWDVYETLAPEVKAEIAELHKYLSKQEDSLDDLNKQLYEIPQMVHDHELVDKEKKEVQKVFFQNVYRLLIDKERGPRLYLFLYAIDRNDYLHLLDFSTPKTEAEILAEQEVAAAAAAALVAEEKVYGESDEVQPVKEEITIDDFGRMDMRVCEIVKCADIRKSNNCYKLTLNDGIKQRVIVSSIKHDYKIEELIGKKIIVLANLKPTRITGVNSEGMLLAATNNACGCQVIFVDDSVPCGTQIG